MSPLIDDFRVVCVVACPLNESEAGVNLVLIENVLPTSLSFKDQAIKHTTLQWSILIFLPYL